EGVLRQSLFFTELLYGKPRCVVALCDSFGPLACFRGDRPLLDGSVARDTTIQHHLVIQEERFTRRLPKNVQKFRRIVGYFRNRNRLESNSSGATLSTETLYRETI